ncbi:MAG: hypothetical protein M1401_02240 [Chloroflexi bacterium]|nr:hypothetical protein [Chloroflexota bacterium]MCL5107697.1 hypothetical protein [Chloroflexota bacterium]
MQEQPVSGTKAAAACHCPYCESAVAAASPICKVCGLELVRCPNCGCVAATGDTVCRSCGQAL